MAEDFRTQLDVWLRNLAEVTDNQRAVSAALRQLAAAGIVVAPLASIGAKTAAGWGTMTRVGRIGPGTKEAMKALAKGGLKGGIVGGIAQAAGEVFDPMAWVNNWTVGGSLFYDAENPLPLGMNDLRQLIAIAEDRYGIEHVDTGGMFTNAAAARAKVMSQIIDAAGGASTIEEAKAILESVGVRPEAFIAAEAIALQRSGDIADEPVLNENKTVYLVDAAGNRIPIGAGVVITGPNGKPVVMLGISSEEAGTNLGTAFTQGQEMDVVWGTTIRNPDGSDGTVLDTRFTDGPVTARAVFADDDQESAYQTAITEEGHTLPDDLKASLVESGWDYLDPMAELEGVLASTTEAMAGYNDLYGPATSFLGRADPVRVAYNSHGDRIGVLPDSSTLKAGDMYPGYKDPRTPLGSVGDIKSALKSGDFLTGDRQGTTKRIDTIEDIEPYFEDQSQIINELNGMSGEQIRALEMEAYRNGLIPKSAVSVSGFGGGWTDDLLIALLTSATIVNETGIMDDQVASTPFEALIAGMSHFGATQRRPLAVWEPPATRIGPSYEDMQYTVAEYFRQKTGRDPTASEMRDLAANLQSQYGRAFDQTDALAEREYYLAAQEDGTEGYLTRDQLKKLEAPFNPNVMQINPVAAFQQHFDSNARYAGAVEAGEQHTEINDLRSSVLGTVAANRRMMGQ